MSPAMANRDIRARAKLFKAPCLLPRRKCTLWTKPYMVRPALVKRHFGNGLRLLGLSPIMHRPNYYLVWVDNRWDIDGDELRDALDSIWEAIGDEFGSRPADDQGTYRWPEEDSGDGCHWWEATAEDVLFKRVLSKMRTTA